jgi:acyl phosphate:glycerol-3-phosphate acyltransferase
MSLGGVAVLFLAFLLGSIPTGLWVARRQGFDLRRVGSGNVGATNVYRSLGPRAGLVVLAVDMAKGGAAVLLALAIAPHGPWPVLAALFAVLGHVLSPLAGFRGGKGVATAGGAILALAPGPALLALLVFAVFVATTRIISLGSMLAALVLPIAVRLTAPDVPWLFPTSIALAALVIFRHRANLARLVRGAEPRIAWRRAEDAPADAEGVPSDASPTSSAPGSGSGGAEWSALSPGAKE